MNTMLSKALREFTTGPLNQLIVNISGQDGDLWEQQFKKFLRKEPCWTDGKKYQVVKLKPLILEFVSTVAISATTSKFVAKEKFVNNTKNNSQVKIVFLGEKFTEWFMSGSGKIEDPISNQTLCYAKLRKSSIDATVITELGGEIKAETTLSEMFSLIELQKDGEDGVLLNNGANIFYIKDQIGVLRSVCVYWDTGGWNITSYSVGNRCRWRGGYYVFFHNSVPESSELSGLAA